MNIVLNHRQFQPIYNFAKQNLSLQKTLAENRIRVSHYTFRQFLQAAKSSRLIKSPCSVLLTSPDKEITKYK